MRTEVAIVATIIFTTLIAPKLRAAEIAGSISIDGYDTAIDAGTFGALTSVTPVQPGIQTVTGVYTGVPLLTPVNFNALQFDSPAPAVQAWTFVVGLQTYSFDVTSVTADYDSPLHEWELGGTGIANITGYTSTPANWTLNLNETGGQIIFNAVTDENASSISTAAAVPEASPLILMSIGFATLCGMGRGATPTHRGMADRSVNYKRQTVFEV